MLSAGDGETVLLTGGILDGQTVLSKGGIFDCQMGLLTVLDMSWKQNQAIFEGETVLSMGAYLMVKRCFRRVHI